MWRFVRNLQNKPARFMQNFVFGRLQKSTAFAMITHIGVIKQKVGEATALPGGLCAFDLEKMPEPFGSGIFLVQSLYCSRGTDKKRKTHLSRTGESPAYNISCTHNPVTMATVAMLAAMSSQSASLRRRTRRRRGAC